LKDKFKIVCGNPKLPFEKVSDEEGEKCEFIACVPLAECPEGLPEGCTESKCAHCGTPVVLDSRDPTAPTRLCTPCAISMMTSTEQ
jgi:hypothetical protein